MIKVTLRQLRAADQHLHELSNREWPAGLALKIAYLLVAVRAKIAVFQPKWQALAAKHGTPVAGQPGTYSFASPEAQAAFDAEAEPMLDTEVELDVNPVPLTEFKGEHGQPAQLRPAMLAALQWYVVAPAEAE